MSRRGLRGPLFLAALLTGLAGAPVGLGAAQEGPTATQPSDGTEEKGWEFSGSAFGYLFFEGSGDYLQPTVSAQKGRLYFEGRYNYEERNTGSLFGGYQFSFGKEVTLDLTPMFGAVVGEVDGVAPALELDLNWKSLNYYSESEYVFDFADREENFFYAWSELSWQCAPWFRAGLALQRTRAYQTDREVEAGPVVGFYFWKMEIATYLFSPFDEDRFAVVAASIEF
jgi:hypothetical protein